MTVETRTTVELGDIQTVEFECKKCGKVTSWPIGKITHPPTYCECGAPQYTMWMSQGGETFMAISSLLVVIKRFSSADEPFKLRFGIRGVSGRASSETD